MKTISPVSRTGLRRRGLGAYSLVEIMVAMLLLSVIVIGLLAMFGQTQQAFRTGLAQTDITEAGRAVISMVARELSQARPTDRPVTNFIIYNPPLTPLAQELPGSVSGTPFRRTNSLQEILFVTRQNKRWNAVGYRVGTPDQGFGALYRFETNLPPDLLYLAPGLFANTPLTNLSRIADGIVHFRLRPCRPDGEWLDTGLTNAVFAWRQGAPDPDFYFHSNAVPAAIDLEIGVLSPRAAENARSLLPNTTAVRTFLANPLRSGAVEIYRQRISLPNVDTSAYP